MWEKKFLVVSFVVVTALAGCKSISEENYDKLKVGMTYSEVTGVIGKPDNCKAILNMKNCVWTDASKEIRVKFAGEQVVFTASRGL